MAAEMPPPDSGRRGAPKWWTAVTAVSGFAFLAVVPASWAFAGIDFADGRLGRGFGTLIAGSLVGVLGALVGLWAHDRGWPDDW